MTDKEIIIDGVDVAECEYLNGFCEKYDTSCDEGGNCYYKQLKRLEQENERLKLKIEELKNRIRILDEEDITVQITEDEFEEYKQLKAENEQLKFRLDTVEADYEASEQENAELKKKVRNNETVYQTELSAYNMECGNLLEENKNLIAENERLKEKLRFDCLKCEYKNTKADVDKYKQTLQEIKEIAEFHTTQADSEDVQEDMKQIIDLITKAESED